MIDTRTDDNESQPPPPDGPRRTTKPCGLCEYPFPPSSLSKQVTLQCILTLRVIWKEESEARELKKMLDGGHVPRSSLHDVDTSRMSRRNLSHLYHKIRATNLIKKAFQQDSTDTNVKSSSRKGKSEERDNGKHKGRGGRVYSACELYSKVPTCTYCNQFLVSHVDSWLTVENQAVDHYTAKVNRERERKAHAESQFAYMVMTSVEDDVDTITTTQLCRDDFRSRRYMIEVGEKKAQSKVHHHPVSPISLPRTGLSSPVDSGSLSSTLLPPPSIPPLDYNLGFTGEKLTAPSSGRKSSPRKLKQKVLGEKDKVECGVLMESFLKAKAPFTEVPRLQNYYYNVENPF